MTNQHNPTCNQTPADQIHTDLKSMWEVSTCRDLPCGGLVPGGLAPGQVEGLVSAGQTIQCHGHITEGQQLTGERREVRVTALQGGASANGFFYGPEALQAVARLIEGAQAYLDHNTTASSRSVRDIIGFYRDANYVAPGNSASGAGSEQGRVEATLHILKSAQWLWTLIKEAVALGRPELIGLSIDIFGTLQPLTEAKTGRRLQEVTGVMALNSCDVVTKPSAGGLFQHILHAKEHHHSGLEAGRQAGVRTEAHALSTSKGETMEQVPGTNASLETPHGARLYGADASGIAENTQQEGRGDARHRPGQPMGDVSHADPSNVTSHIDPSNVTSHAGTTNEAGHVGTSTASMPVHGAGQLPTAAIQHVTESSSVNGEELLRELRMERAQLLLERRLTESVLPEAVRGMIRQKFAGRIFEGAELDRELTLNRQMLAELTHVGLVRDSGYERVEFGAQITEAEKMQVAFDLMFDKNGDIVSESERTKFGNLRGFQSIREAYARVTGDAVVAGITDRTLLGNIRVSEHAPLQRITEADTTTATFTYLLGTSMNKRLLRDYQTWTAEWMKFCTIVPIRDFKQQTRVRMGAFGSLPIVPEDSAYTSVSLQDSAATYVPQKRGNLVTVSRETIVNDDLNAIRTIPTKLAAAAAYTLAEFVYGFLSSNPAIYDGSALFTTGAPHSNLGTSALSTSAMQSGVTTMREQTNFAGKRIGLRPKFLVVPPELEFAAMVMTKSAGVPGSPNNDINPMLGYVTPIVSPQLTNTSQWYMVADPQVVDTIEIGFVGGQVNPVLLIQDSPLYGLNFSQDVVS